MTNRIIFVGLHHKPGMKPLDSQTKSGKMIDRIMEQLPSGVKVKKSNLFDLYRLPENEEKGELVKFWLEDIKPGKDDVVVLLGAMVHDNCPQIRVKSLIKIAHPASKRSHKEMDAYVDKAVKLITDNIN